MATPVGNLFPDDILAEKFYTWRPDDISSESILDAQKLAAKITKAIREGNGRCKVSLDDGNGNKLKDDTVDYIIDRLIGRGFYPELDIDKTPHTLKIRY